MPTAAQKPSIRNAVITPANYEVRDIDRKQRKMAGINKSNMGENKNDLKAGQRLQDEQIAPPKIPNTTLHTMYHDISYLAESDTAQHGVLSGHEEVVDRSNHVQLTQHDGVCEAFWGHVNAHRRT